jgi:Protein of unknown function (DUF3828)
MPLAFAACVLTTAAYAQFPTPEEGVRAIYTFYAGSDSKGFPQDAATAKRFFDPSLAKQWAAAKNIDADFFIQGQDWELSELKVDQAAINGNKANVAVGFTNFKKPIKLTYEMVKSNDGWRISDVKAGRSSFRDALKKARHT